MAIDPRVYVVGDIHGCLDELLLLEADIREHAAGVGTDPLILSVGDLVDRGPKSSEVVERFRVGRAAGTHQAVLGNHDVMFMDAVMVVSPDLLEAASGNEALPWWLRNMPSDSRLLTYDHWFTQGGEETLSEHGSIDPENPFACIPIEMIRFFLQSPLWWMGDGLAVTHALATPEDVAAVRGEAPDYDAFLRIIWNRHVPKESPWPLHVSGHTPLREVHRDGGMVMIDTACVYGGSLTAFHPASGDFLSVDGIR